MPKKGKNKVDDYKEVKTFADVIKDSPNAKVEAEKEKLVQQIVGMVETADMWYTSNKEEEFTYAQDASISYLRNKSSYTTRSTICHAAIEKGCRAIISKYMTVLATFLMQLMINGVGISDIQKARALKREIVTVLNKMPNFFNNLLTYVRQVVVYGTGVGKVIYIEIFRKIKGRTYDEKTGEYTIEEKTVPIYKGPYFFPLNVTKEFRIDGNPPISLEGAWKFHRTYKSYKELKDAGIYKNLDKITFPVVGGDVGSTSQPVDYEGLNKTTERNATDDDTVNVIEAWSPDDSRRVVILNKQVVGLNEANPFFYGRHPFVATQFEAIDFNFYGRGAPAKGRGEYELLNTMTNLAVDSATDAVKPMWKGIEGEVLSDYIIWRHNGVIKVPSGDSLELLAKPFIGMDVFKLMGDLERSIEVKLGSGYEQTGAGEGGATRKTAREFMGRFKLGSELHSLNLKMLTETGIKEIIRRVYWIILQCMPHDYRVILNEGEPVTINPEELPLDLDFDAQVGEDQLTKDQISEDLSFLMQTLGPVLAQIAPPQVLLKIVSKLLEAKNIRPEEVGLDEQSLNKLPQTPLGREEQVPPEGTPVPMGVPNA